VRRLHRGGSEIRPQPAGVPVAIDGVSVIPGGEAEAILTNARDITQEMDRAKESLKSEDPETVLRQGSDEP